MKHSINRMLQIAGPPPKISCLLVTGNGRFEYLKKSVRCYDSQLYPNRELVIVNEGPKSYQDQIVEYIGDREDVRYVFLDGWYSLGALRNISIALCHGDLFVQWDDDDFNTPERLVVQYNHLSKHQTAKVCFLSDQLHYYFDTNYLFWENWAEFCSGGHAKFSLIPGTIMAWKESFHGRYPSAGPWCSAGEDSVLAYNLCEDESQVALLPDYGYMQVYSYHGKNVWDVNHHLNISRERAMNCTFMLRHRERICATIDFLKLEGTIKVMGREGLAFTHEARS